MGGRAQPRRRARVVLDATGAGPVDSAYLQDLAADLGLAGFVRSGRAGLAAAGVLAEVEGDPDAVVEFLEIVRHGAGGGLTVEDVPPLGGAEFAVASSPAAADAGILAADAGLCGACREELFDRAGRRFRYPFASCARCGPAYSLRLGPGAGRAATTMAPFAMCPRCRAEHDDPSGRRFGALGACCPECGPRAAVLSPTGAVVAGDLVRTSVRMLMDGQILAVKEPGGWQLWADAASGHAVAALRERLGEARPFAALCADLAVLEAYFLVDSDLTTVLGSRRRPRVLLTLRDTGRLAPALAPGHREVAVGLPASGLAYLLADALRRPIAVAELPEDDAHAAGSGNEAARRRLGGVADGFLAHERAIAAPAADSVVRVVAGRELPLRRGRGHAPEPVPLPWVCLRPVLALGTDAGATPCLAYGRRAVLPPEPAFPPGERAVPSVRGAVERLRELTGVVPLVVAYDAEPGARTAALARELAADSDLGLVAVPRAQAHVAACLADTGQWGPAIGVALGEGCADLLAGDLARLHRVGGLDRGVGDLLAAVGGLLRVRGVDLEQLADPEETGAYAASVSGGAAAGPLVVHTEDLLGAAGDDRAAGTPPGVVAARFHNGLADALADAVLAVRGNTGISTVALSGGLLGNGLLLGRLLTVLTAGGCLVLTHVRVPPGEGGVALGQAVLAAARPGGI